MSLLEQAMLLFPKLYYFMSSLSSQSLDTGAELLWCAKRAMRFSGWLKQSGKSVERPTDGWLRRYAMKVCCRIVLKVKSKDSCDDGSPRSTFQKRCKSWSKRTT